MEKLVIYCDLCGEPDARRFVFTTDRKSDGNGGHDLTNSRVDLCYFHSSKQLELFILALPWTARQKFTADIVKGKKLYLSHMGAQERKYGVRPEENKAA